MANRYLEKIAGLRQDLFKPVKNSITAKINHISGFSNSTSAGGVKGSVFGKAPPAMNKSLSQPKTI